MLQGGNCLGKLTNILIAAAILDLMHDYTHTYSYLRCHCLINEHQFGFTQGDSTINQLIAICKILYKNIDCENEILAVFLDLTKAFDKEWHKGLLYKIKKIGIKGNLHKWLTSYPSNKKQRVVLNGVSSDLKELTAGFPQGSVLGPLLFLIYINDICDDLSSDSFLFADDTSFFKVVNNNILQAAKISNEDLDKINAWTKKWLVYFNTTKTILILFSKKCQPSNVPPLLLGTHSLSKVNENKYLGLLFTPNLSWTKHITAITAKANRRLGVIKKYKYTLSRKTLNIGYITFIRPILEYGDVIYDACSIEDTTKLEKVQLEAARIVTRTKFRTSSK